MHCTIALKDTFQLRSITIPQRELPKDFFLNTKDFYCGGYFVGYDCSYTPQEISNLFIKKQYTTLAQKSADFFILFIDKVAKEIFVLTSQSGRFPCYFTIEKNMLFLSTDFGWVKKQRKRVTIDLNFVLNYLSSTYETLLTDQTQFKEIKQVPPATLLAIKQNGDLALTPYITLQDFLPKEQRYSSSEFAEKIVALLEQLIEERLRAIGDIPFAAELSSGFDSSLVAAILAKKAKRQIFAMSEVSTLSPAYNVKGITTQFGKKHNIAVQFVNIDYLFPFSTEEGREILQRHPYPIDLTYMMRLHSAKLGYPIIFEGTGGDELYKAGEGTQWFRYPLQIAYFMSVAGTKTGIDQIFTKEGLRILYSRDRFSKTSLFASGIATSATSVKLRQFPSYWETGTWGMAPLSDHRLVQLATYGPKKGTKRSIWQKREDIYTREQIMHEKGDFGDHMAQVFTNSFVRGKVIALLEKSFLAQIGILRASDIIDNLRANRTDKYSGELLPLLVSIIYLEHFLQSNSEGISIDTTSVHTAGDPIIPKAQYQSHQGQGEGRY